MVVLHPPNAQPLAQAETLHWGIGGAESNVALHLRAMGHSAGWMSRVGDDPFGERILTHLQRSGVDVSAVNVDPSAPTAVYFKDPHPEGTRVFYYRRGSAASRMGPGDLEAVSFQGVKLVHVSGITAGLSESCDQMLRAVYEKAHREGAHVSFDVNHRPGVWDAAEAAGPLADHARRADLVLVGRDEAETLWGTPTAVSIAEALNLTGTLVVKDGDVGATEFHQGQETFVPAPTVDVVEPVGAGDAFAAGYLAAWSAAEPAETRLQHGHQRAARALTSFSDVVL